MTWSRSVRRRLVWFSRICFEDTLEVVEARLMVAMRADLLTE